MRQTLLRTGIVLFCLWHMFAVAVTSIPRTAKDAFSVATRQTLLPFVTPYLQITSQWQLWDLFAPDPLRRVTLYGIEVNRNDRWEEIAIIKPGTYAFTHHATYFKYLIHVMDSNNASLDAAKERFLHLQCQEHDIAPSTQVRLVLYAVILPWNTSPVTPSFWKDWRPSIQQTIEMAALCPPAVS